MNDIIDTAVAAGSFKTLVSAVQAAGLVETLKGKGPFTVFAPDDEAFAKLPTGTVEGLLKNIPKLKAILMYHLVAGKLTVDEIGQMKTAKTIQGQEVKIDAHKWHLHMNPKINDANITSKDIVTDNGMIHVLNRVLMPNMDLTCSVCGMGFMNMDDLNAHTKTAHIVEKMPEQMPTAQEMPVIAKAPETMPVVVTEPAPAAETIPAVEKAPEQMPTAEMMPVVAKAQESTPAEEEMPVVEKVETIPVIEEVSTSEKEPEKSLTTKEVWGPLSSKAKGAVAAFEILCDAAGKFRFHLKATNGQIIAVSQSYGTKESAIRGIASIKKNAPIARTADFTTVGGTLPESTHAPGIVQDPVFEIQSNDVDKYRFHLKAGNGQIIAVSQSYLTRQSAEKGIASVKKNAPIAKVVDHTLPAT